MPPIPPPLGLPPPKREIRALRRTAQVGAIVIAAGVIGVVYYGITHIAGSNDTAQPKPTADAAGGDGATADMMRNAPSGNEIRARQRRPIAIRETTAQPPNVPQPTHVVAEPEAPADPVIPDDMTEAAIAGRRAAWQAYYQQLNETGTHRIEARRTALAADIVPTEPAPLPGGGSSALSSGDRPADTKPTSFFAANASNPATDYSPFTVTNPISAYELKATDIITAKLVSGMNSDSPGIIKALVTKTVTDHATGMHILIPQGSTLVGFYDTNVAYGQTRMVSAWTRIIYPAPCDQSLDLGSMPGADQTGQAGFEDLTDNHLGKVFTAAILVSVFGAAAQLSQPQQSAFSTYSPTQTAAGAVGQQMSSLGAEFARKGLSIPPTERIRQGYPFAVMLTKDIAFDHPWVDGVCADNEVTPE